MLQHERVINNLVLNAEEYMGDKRYLELKSIFNKAFKAVYNNDNSAYHRIEGVDMFNDGVSYLRITYGVDYWKPTGFDKRPSDTGGFKYGGRGDHMYIIIRTNQGSTFHISESGYVSLNDKV